MLDLPIWLIILLAALGACILVGWLTGVRWRRRALGPEPVTAGVRLDAAAEAARRQALEARGAELIDRRVDLDLRRGTLGGDVALADELDRLWQRRQSGEIDEDEFESEKIRLLGG